MQTTEFNEHQCKPDIIHLEVSFEQARDDVYTKFTDLCLGKSEYLTCR